MAETTRSSRLKKRYWALALGAVASAAAAVYFITWWSTEEEKEGCVEGSVEARSERRSYDATSRALGEQNEADDNLQNHFQSIQKISDATTLPQMLVELEMGLDRAANVDLLISQLRQANKFVGLGGQGRSKVDLWQELKLVAWARTMSCAWLVALADLLLRVQLNILGRHIFLQTHLLDPEQNGWTSPVPARRVTERAQELFIEYTHYLPEQASGRIVAYMRSVVSRELGSTDLSSPMDASKVLQHASSIHSAFEEWALEQGWAHLVLPTQAEASQYFASFRGAPPDTGALGQEFLELDEEVIQGMVDELHRVMRSARFSSAVLVAVQQAARHLAKQIEAEMGGSTLPLAKLLPKITAAGNTLLHAQEEGNQGWLRAIAELPQVEELCASVYSCGPPP